MDDEFGHGDMADDEFPQLGCQGTAGEVIRSPVTVTNRRRRRRNRQPGPIHRRVDSETQLATPHRYPTRGEQFAPNRAVQEPLTKPWSASAPCFTPRPTPNTSQTPRLDMDMDLHRSPATTGVGETKSLRKAIENNGGPVCLARTTEILQPVALAGVAEPSGLAGTDASSSVDTETSMRTVSDGIIMDTRMNITNRCRVRDIQMETGHHLMMCMDKYTEPRTDRMDPVMLESAQRKGDAVMLPTLPNDLQPVAGSTVDIISEPVVKKCHQIPSGMGANVSDDEQNTDNTWASGPVTRPTSSKPRGDVDVRSPNEGCQSITICTKIAFPDNSYQPLVTGPVGANVSEDAHYRSQPRNTDNSIGRNDFTPIYVSDVSPDNSYQSLITSQVGANVSEEGQDTGQPRNTENSLGQNDVTPMNPSADSRGNQSLPVCGSDVSPDNSYQSLVTSPVGANVSEEGQDTGQPRNTENSLGQNDATPMNPSADSRGNQSLRVCGSDVSPDNLYQSLVTSPVGANVSEEGHDTGRPRKYGQFYRSE